MRAVLVVVLVAALVAVSLATTRNIEIVETVAPLREPTTTSTSIPAPIPSSTSVVLAPAGGSVTARPAPTRVPRASRSHPSRPPAASTVPDPSTSSSGLRLSSTAYCLTGAMANGQPARRGAVAANRWPLGTRLRVSPSPVGEIVVVEDRIGHGSQLDFAMPGECRAAIQWGRRVVSVEVLDG